MDGYNSLQVRDGQGNLMPNCERGIASFSGTLIRHRTTGETWLVSGNVGGFIDTVLRDASQEDLVLREVEAGQSYLGD